MDIRMRMEKYVKKLGHLNESLEIEDTVKRLFEIVDVIERLKGLYGGKNEELKDLEEEVKDMVYDMVGILKDMARFRDVDSLEDYVILRNRLLEIENEVMEMIKYIIGG